MRSIAGRSRASQQKRLAHVRLGSHSVIPRCLLNVRFGPLYGLKSDISRGPRSANRVPTRRSKKKHRYSITSSAQQKRFRDLSPRALAVVSSVSAQRRARVVGVASAGECGVVKRSRNRLFAPKGTPKLILDKLTDALDRALDDDISRKRLLDLVNEIPDKASRGQQPLADLVQRDVGPLDTDHQGSRSGWLVTRLLMLSPSQRP
jgi:Tripartite tricarboxylate transporter family receptor